LVFDEMDIVPRTRGRPAKDEDVAVVRELTRDDLVATLGSKGTLPLRIGKLRDRHHALARALASGMPDYEAALLTGYDAARVSVLKSDPTFQDLVTFYRSTVNDAYADMHDRMASLGRDVVEEFHSRLEDAPDSLPTALLLDTIKIIADRTGHAPTAKTVNVNVNVDMATKLQEARKRAQDMARGPLLEGTLV
jgi:hypothetical protein